METIVKPAEPRSTTWTGSNHYTPSGGLTTVKSGQSTQSWNYRSSRTVVHDKDRFRFEALNGYPKNYGYSATCSQSSVDVSPIRCTVRHTNGSTCTWETYASLTTNLASTGGGWSISGNWWGNQVSTLRNNVIASCNSEVRSQYVSAVETGVELRKSADMIVNTIKAVGKAALQVKKGKFLQACETLGLPAMSNRKVRHMRKRSMSDNWLEYRYGWQPLYFTVYGEMVRQYELAKKKARVRRVSATRSASSSGNLLGSNGPYTAQSDAQNASVYQQFYVDIHEDRQVSLKQVWYFEVLNNAYEGSQSLGLTNPALVAWELVPLSFAVDWFVNVSDVLESLDTWIGKRFITGTETIIYRSTVRRAGRKGTISSGWTNTSWSAGSCTFDKVSMTRTVLTTQPSIRFQIANGLNAKRVVDAIALLRQAFR